MAGRINLPGGGIGYSVDLTDTMEEMKRQMVFKQYAEKVAYYQRIVKPEMTEDMAKAILEICAGQIYNLDATDEEMDEFAEKTAEKWHVDGEELVENFFTFMDWATEES